MVSYILFDVITYNNMKCTFFTFQLKIIFKKIEQFFLDICRTLRWYVTVEITFIRESIQGDEHTTASFRTTLEIMADVSTYHHKEL